MNHVPLRFDARGLSPREDVLEETLPVVVVLCVLLATLLRLYHLGAQSLWVDELLTLEQGRVVGHTLWEQFRDDYQTPLPMLVVSGLSRLSLSETWLRLPGAVLGILSIPVFLDIARHYLTRQGAVLATILLALHPMHIAHCQEVRGYAYLLFFGLAATSVALRDDKQWGVGRWLAIVLLGVAATLSNLQGLFWMAGLGLLLLVGRRMPRRHYVRHLSAFLAIALLTSPWWLRSLGILEVTRVIPGEAVGVPLRGASTSTLWSLPYAGFVLSFGRTLGPTVAQLHDMFQGSVSVVQAFLALGIAQLVWVGCAALVVLGLALVGVRQLGRRTLDLVLWVSFVVAIAAVLSLRNVKPFNPRYVIGVLPALLIVIGAGLQALPRRASMVMLAAWILLTAVSLQRYYFEPEHGHADVRAAARLIEERGGAADAILVPTVDLVFAQYYRGPASVASAYEKDFVSDDASWGRVQEVDPAARYLWYVEARPWFADPEGRLPRVLGDHYRQLSEFRVPGVRLLLFDRQAPPLDGQD